MIPSLREMLQFRNPQNLNRDGDIEYKLITNMPVLEKDYLPFSFPDVFVFWYKGIDAFLRCPYIEKTKTSGNKIDYLHFSMKWPFFIWMLWSKTDVKVTVTPTWMPYIKIKYFNIWTKLLIYQCWRIKLKLLIQIYSVAYLLVLNFERFTYSILFSFLIGNKPTP